MEFNLCIKYGFQFPSILMSTVGSSESWLYGLMGETIMNWCCLCFFPI